MNGFQAIKRQLLPLLKGFPFILIIFFGALYTARKVIQYTPNSYQTLARIKLDDQKYGFSSTSLYKDFDVFSTQNKIQSEAMVLKSPLLVGMALDSLAFDIALYRKGQVRNTMLYDDSPIIINYDFINQSLYNRDYFVSIDKEGFYGIRLNEEDSVSNMVQLGQPFLLDGGVITISKNDTLLAYRSLDIEGEYIAHIFSKDGLIADVTERLDVVEVDKEIAILRVVYKDQHPQKVADLANALCATYITDYVETKSQAAEQTVGFIDEKLAEVLSDLQQAEIELEQFKAVKGIVNTRQETETGLRQISNLEVSLINLEMNEKAILELEEYISAGDYFSQTAINFGFGDLLMTELVKKLKMWQDERYDLLLKYTEESDQITSVDKKIIDLKAYIVEAIKRNKKEISTKREEIERSLEIVSHQFDGLSTTEKELRILERNFHLLEQVYNFLSQKKIEASIAASANLAFHRIIEKAIVPSKPISPNRTLITFVSGLLGLIIGIAFIYLRQYAMARVASRLDIERHTTLPLLGVVRKGNTTDDFDAIIKHVKLKGLLNQPLVAAVSSTINSEGKTYVTEHLGTNMAAFGLSVCVLSTSKGDDFSASSPLEGFLENPSKSQGLVHLHLNLFTNLNWEKQLAELKSHFDVVLIDAPAAAMCIEGAEVLKAVDLGLYVLRANKTSLDYIATAEKLKEEFGIENIQLILNDAHRASNFNGSYVGTRFRNQVASQGLKGLFAKYLNTYMR
jgi:uncharacterized protein involved in exopolysaccharide biosynthesis